MHIHLLGPSGSGTSTLGKAISTECNYPWFDSDDFFWMKTDQPFSVKRKRDERIEMLKSTLEMNDNWVLSGNITGWGDFLRNQFDLVIYKYVDPEIRIERLNRREKDRFGKRIDYGNDMYENHVKFIEWARSYENGDMNMRSKLSENEWMKDLKCEILRFDGINELNDEVDIVISRIKKIIEQSLQPDNLPCHGSC